MSGIVKVPLKFLGWTAVAVAICILFVGVGKSAKLATNAMYTLGQGVGVTVASVPELAAGLSNGQKAAERKAEQRDQA